MIAQKTIASRVCPAISARGMVCGKQIDTDAKGCKTHPNGVGSSKIIDPITPEQAAVWMEIDTFFTNPIDVMHFRTDSFCDKDKKITTTNVYRVDPTSIARDLTNRIGQKVSSTSIIFLYCLDRLFRKLGINKEEFWYPILSTDSEKVLGFNCSSKFYSYFINKVKDLTLLNDIEAIQYVSVYEYGYVLKPLRDISTVFTADIDLKNCTFMEGKILLNKGLNAYNKYWHENIKHNIPIGVVYKEDNDKYVIVDGFHRYLSAAGLGHETERFIVCG